ncbi:unnamed protein product [Rotaria socialis]|uniref:Transposase n=1 Tax=Rotaria socialis TaxID=392032 RepID=A0A818BPI1_9BILA|nr:unnamed protein product [Rotaria socialis]CAF4473280.1 unnamed protein product [Rotaria socialis]
MHAFKIEKENIKKKIDEGIFKTCSKPSSATASWWHTFLRIKDGGGAASTSKSQDISDMFSKDKISLTSSKAAFAEACAKFCAYDLRSFETVNGQGFELLCQSLLDIAHKHPHRIQAKSIISDPTTISRKVQKLAEENRSELINRLLFDLKKIKLFGITTDFWKNKYSSESYLTLTLHYNKGGVMNNFVLKTVLFSDAKTGENTKRMIWNILKSYDINPDSYEIIYITDNGSNLISALNGEAHIRCICHCINLVVSQSIEACPSIDLIVAQCRDLVCHFKRCELQSKLSSTLKQDICTRWNSTYDTIWSIYLNYDDVQEILLNRNEEKYLSGIDRYLIKDITDLLSVFKICSEKLSADDNPTLHAVLPWFVKLKKTCEPRSTDKLYVIQLKKALLEKLDEKIWITDIHYIATFLHPETKSLPTLSHSERNKVVQSVKKMLKTVGLDENSADTIIVTDNDKIKRRRNKRAKRADITVDDVLKEFASNDNSLTDSDNDVYDEVLEYMKSKVIYGKGEDVLSWWKKYS